VRLVYLPPYSPDFNPIEEAFSKIKAWIRRNNDIFTYGEDDEPHALIYDMLEARNIITELDAIGYFIHAGYF
jgi:transposase